MIPRAGVDLVEISRIRHSMENPRFLLRFFGERERAQLAARGFPPQSVAASFCAKEAFAKALGTGVRGFSLHEVELLRDELGAPYLRLAGRARRLAEASGLVFAVSVSHTREQALAFVVALAPGPTDRPDGAMPINKMG